MENAAQNETQLLVLYMTERNQTKAHGTVTVDTKHSAPSELCYPTESFFAEVCF